MFDVPLVVPQVALQLGQRRFVRIAFLVLLALRLHFTVVNLLVQFGEILLDGRNHLLPLLLHDERLSLAKHLPESA